ncbi:cGMP-specific 3',5'-cyclic phosphodiesterase [Larimichthys crocea]|uniref:Uncharacterized protein n=1 Tax=Larimichthys crocea TaxID=215358 RepID=A0ACD3Q664_LARCR|nr:cGMP-specific 3',5'-cyclic phosphodiesterase [Larimichthys crocea]
MNSFSSVFHMEYEELGEVIDAPKRDCDVSQINYMYAQYVKNTMQPLSIADVTKDQRFPWTSENPDHTRNHIKSLLCSPIRNGKKDKVIARKAQIHYRRAHTCSQSTTTTTPGQSLSACVHACTPYTLRCGGAVTFRVSKGLVVSRLCRRGGIAGTPEFMPVDSECEEELQEECGISQLEARLQHGSEHVRPAQVRTLTGQCSQSLARKS